MFIFLKANGKKKMTECAISKLDLLQLNVIIYIF
jgi:hypothetical protein